jgi:MFS family permease
MGLIGAAFGLGFIVGPGLGGLLTQPQLGRLGYQLPIFTATDEVGLAFMIVGIVSTLNQGFFAGRLARRFGEAPVLAFGMLLFGSSLVAQVLAPVAWFPAVSLDLGPWTLPVVQGWIIPIVMAVGAAGMSLAMPNVSALISRSTPADRQGAMLGLNMASGSIARIFGPIAAGTLYSVLGHDWPFLVGAALTVPAAVLAINAGRAFRRRQADEAAEASPA